LILAVEVTNLCFLFLFFSAGVFVPPPHCLLLSA
jgi:hypothetical protein